MNGIENRQLVLVENLGFDFKSVDFLETYYDVLCKLLTPGEIGRISLDFRGMRMIVTNQYRHIKIDWQLNDAQMDHFLNHMTAMAYMEGKGIRYTYDQKNYVYSILGRDKDRYPDEDDNQFLLEAEV